MLLLLGDIGWDDQRINASKVDRGTGGRIGAYCRLNVMALNGDACLVLYYRDLCTRLRIIGHAVLTNERTGLANGEFCRVFAPGGLALGYVMKSG